MDKNNPLDSLSDLRSEKSVSSLLIQHPQLFSDVSTKLEAKDFYGFQYGQLYSILSKMYSEKLGKDISFDISNVQSSAKKYGINASYWTEGEGFTVLQSLQNNRSCSVEGLDDYVKSICNYSIRRKIWGKCLEKANYVLSDKVNEMDSGELITNVEKEISDIALDYHGLESEFTKVFEGHTDRLMKRLANPVKFVGLPTGFEKFDDLTLGLRRKTVYVTIARFKVGKSAFCSNIGLNIAEKLNIPVLYLDTEMDTEEVETRAFAKLADESANNLLTGSVREEKRNELVEISRKLEDLPFYHMRLMGYNMDKITAIVRKFVNHYVGFNDKGKTKDCLVIFDYIKMPDNLKSMNVMEKETQVLGQITTGLKDLAGSLDIPLLTAAQLNREGDVAASDRIAWFADVMMRWEAKSEKEIDDEGMPSGSHRLRITASRNGGVCPEGINFLFHKPTLKITEAVEQVKRHD